MIILICIILLKGKKPKLDVNPTETLIQPISTIKTGLDENSNNLNLPVSLIDGMTKFFTPSGKQRQPNDLVSTASCCDIIKKESQQSNEEKQSIINTITSPNAFSRPLSSENLNNNKLIAARKILKRSRIKNSKRKSNENGLVALIKTENDNKSLMQSELTGKSQLNNTSDKENLSQIHSEQANSFQSKLTSPNFKKTGQLIRIKLGKKSSSKHKKLLDNDMEYTLNGERKNRRGDRLDNLVDSLSHIYCTENESRSHKLPIKFSNMIITKQVKRQRKQSGASSSNNSSSSIMNRSHSNSHLSPSSASSSSTTSSTLIVNSQQIKQENSEEPKQDEMITNEDDLNENLQRDDTVQDSTYTQEDQQNEKIISFRKKHKKFSYNRHKRAKLNLSKTSPVNFRVVPKEEQIETATDRPLVIDRVENDSEMLDNKEDIKQEAHTEIVLFKAQTGDDPVDQPEETITEKKDQSEDKKVNKQKKRLKLLKRIHPTEVIATDLNASVSTRLKSRLSNNSFSVNQTDYDNNEIEQTNEPEKKIEIVKTEDVESKKKIIK